MNRNPFVVQPRDYEPPLNVLGVDITILASNRETRGCEVTLQQGAEGIGPPPHRHDWDEAFFVLDGEVEIHCEGRSLVCGRGTFVYVPARTLHGYRFAAGGGRMFEFSGRFSVNAVAARDQAGSATRMFANVSRDAPEGTANLPKLVRVLEDNGVTLAA